MEELPQIAIRLEDAGAALALYNLFEARQNTRIQRSETQDEQHLQDVVRDRLSHEIAPGYAAFCSVRESLGGNPKARAAHGVKR